VCVCVSVNGIVLRQSACLLIDKAQVSPMLFVWGAKGFAIVAAFFAYKLLGLLVFREVPEKVKSS